MLRSVKHGYPESGQTVQVAKRRSIEGRREFWREFIAEVGGSDEPVRSLCQRHGVRPNQYYWWRKRLAKDPSAPAVVKTIPFALLMGMRPVSAEPMFQLVLDDANRQSQWRLDEATLSTVSFRLDGEMTPFHW